MKLNKRKTLLLLALSGIFFTVSCNRYEHKKEEQLTITEYQQPNAPVGIPTKDNAAVSQLSGSPNSVLLTGLNNVRLVTVYKVNPKDDRNIEYDEGTSYYDYYDSGEEDDFKYYMPGMDIIYGYNLINIGHYDIQRDTLSYFFENPVLVRALYFPGIKPDSLNHKLVSRDYFMVSVYDEDTNNDSLINKKDLRRIYHIDQLNRNKTQLIPADYSVIRSTYDYRNDIMYLYARYDANKNGTPDKEEPISIFWIRLSDSTVVRRIM